MLRREPVKKHTEVHGQIPVGKGLGMLHTRAIGLRRGVHEFRNLRAHLFGGDGSFAAARQIPRPEAALER